MGSERNRKKKSRVPRVFSTAPGALQPWSPAALQLSFILRPPSDSEIRGKATESHEASIRSQTERPSMSHVGKPTDKGHPQA